VGLVVFSSDVTIIGDGSKDPIVITGDKLNNYDTLLQIASTYELSLPISATKEKLVKSLYDLTESGSTALGPAVVVSVGMLQNSPGSTIVLATDGLANTGVGAMDSYQTMTSANQFYEEIGFYAKQKSITINVVGIKGDVLNINNLGKLADITAGSVDVVDPVQITQNFASVLQSSLVATNVSVKLFLHKAFKAPEDGEWVHPPGNKLYVERNIGNAHEDTEITAEFELHSAEHLSRLFSPEEKSDKKIEVPFQVQIVYFSTSGMKCLRVITRSREVTTNQAEAAEEVDLPLLGIHANIKTAQLAQRGDILSAKETAQQYSDLMKNNISSEAERISYSAWNNNQVNLFNSPEIQQQEIEQITAPPPPQPSNTSFFSNFTFSNPFSSFTSPSTANTTSPSAAIFKYDDSTSNQIYQQKDHRKNKKQWTEKRKY
jgi:hypothetical protein